MAKEYKTINQIAGPLVFVEKTEPVGYKEIVNIKMPDGTIRRGQVLDYFQGHCGCPDFRRYWWA